MSRSLTSVTGLRIRAPLLLPSGLRRRWRDAPRPTWWIWKWRRFCFYTIVLSDGDFDCRPCPSSKSFSLSEPLLRFFPPWKLKISLVWCRRKFNWGREWWAAALKARPWAPLLLWQLSIKKIYSCVYIYLIFIYLLRLTIKHFAMMSPAPPLPSGAKEISLDAAAAVAV